MAYNLSTIRTAVRNRLDDTSYDSGVLDQFINDTNRAIVNHQPWRFMEKTFSGNVTIGQPSYTLPTDFQAAVSLRITAPDANASFVRYMSFEIFDQLYPDPTQTTSMMPFLWYLFGTTFNLYPTPDQAYTMDLRYLKIPTTLTGDSDVPDIPEAFQEVLVLGTWKRALEQNDNFDQAQVVGFQYNFALSDMNQRLQTRQRGEVPRIRRNRPYGYYQDKDWR